MLITVVNWLFKELNGQMFTSLSTVGLRHIKQITCRLVPSLPFTSFFPYLSFYLLHIMFKHGLRQASYALGYGLSHS